MLLHALFTPATGGLAAATAYRDALDAFWGFPVGDDWWSAHFAIPWLNVAAQADPLDPDAKFAVDISCPFAPAGQDPNNTSLFVYALAPATLAVVPWPEGAIEYQLEPNDAEWLQPPDA